MVQPQQPPPQQPPPPPPDGGRAEEAEDDEDAAPVTATVESSFTVSPCPSGQDAGAEDSAIGRFSSKVVPQARQRYS